MKTNLVTIKLSKLAIIDIKKPFLGPIFKMSQ